MSACRKGYRLDGSKLGKGGANEQNENEPAYQDQTNVMLQEFANS